LSIFTKHSSKYSDTRLQFSCFQFTAAKESGYSDSIVLCNQGQFLALEILHVKKLQEDKNRTFFLQLD